MAEHRRRQVAVIGVAAADEPTTSLAHEVGRLLAEAGVTLLSGGLGGVMEAASQGAQSAGGLVVGVVPGPGRGSGNPYLDVEVVTNIGHARNVILAHSADAMIAVAGSYGTLSEIAIGLKLGKPVIGLGSWEIPGVIQAVDATQAVALALENMGGNRA
jgi:uncharacterized protein (TIGR00725 family)